MSTNNKVPEVDIMIDEKSGVIREIKSEKTRSKSGHERRVNTGIYAVLIIMSVIWLAPFVFLVFQSFRSYNGDGAGGMVSYLLPKEWSLDNYRWLFDGSDLFPWLGKSLLMVLICTALQTVLNWWQKKRKKNRPDVLSFIPGALVLMVWTALSGGQTRVWTYVLAALLACAAGYLFTRIYLKSGLPETIPGAQAENENKLLTLAVEWFILYLLLRFILVPVRTNNYLGWYGNTLVIALFTAVLQTIIVLSVSYALSRLRFKGRKLIMNAVLVLGLFPGFLTMITLYFLLKQLGLTQEGAVPGLILIYVASSGMGYYISKGFFDTIPKSLDESARIDGATRFQVFLKIIMPLAKPIVIYTVLMAFMAPWGDYVFASYIAFGSEPNYNVAVGLYRWVNVADYQGYFTRFCAGGVLVALPITALFLALQRYYVEGVTGGAVKG